MSQQKPIHSWCDKEGCVEHIENIERYLNVIGGDSVGAGVLAEIIIDSGRLDCQLCDMCLDIGEDKWTDLEHIVIWNGWRMCMWCAKVLKEWNEDEIYHFNTWMMDWEYSKEDFTGDGFYCAKSASRTKIE